MKGRRLDPQRLGGDHLPADRQPGDYWRILDRTTGEPMDAKDYPSTATAEQLAGNLTGGVWGYEAPNGGGYGVLSIHTVREHEDGTISVRPGDGSSNSILHHGHIDGEPVTWHGYIEHGVWTSV